MATTQSNQTSDAIQQVHKQFSESLRRQAEQIESLNRNLKLLQNEQQQLEEVASHVLEPLERSLAGGNGTNALLPSSIPACVRRLSAASYADQVFEALAQEAAHMNVRAAVFDVRGHAAWGASASGFGPELSRKNLGTLVVALNHEGPFRRAFEMAEAVETNAAGLEKNHNILEKLAPAANTRVLLLPVLSADSVTAILYAETGEQRDSTLIDALKVLAVFAGAQVDRLMALGGGLAAVESAPGIDEAEPASEQAAGDEKRHTGPKATVSPEIPGVVSPEADPAEPPRPPSEVEQISAASPEPTQPAEEAAAPAQAVEVTHPTEEEKKIHRDARRFSKLLVSEIELYSKSSVEAGRRNRDLYQRLKKDIDRSRETYEKRFAHTVARQVDYFHEELVRTLAENDPMLLGSGYPGPSV